MSWSARYARPDGSLHSCSSRKGIGTYGTAAINMWQYTVCPQPPALPSIPNSPALPRLLSYQHALTACCCWCILRHVSRVILLIHDTPCHVPYRLHGAPPPRSPPPSQSFGIPACRLLCSMFHVRHATCHAHGTHVPRATCRPLPAPPRPPPPPQTAWLAGSPPAAAAPPVGACIRVHIRGVFYRLLLWVVVSRSWTATWRAGSPPAAAACPVCMCVECVLRDQGQPLRAAVDCSRVKAQGDRQLFCNSHSVCKLACKCMRRSTERGVAASMPAVVGIGQVESEVGS